MHKDAFFPNRMYGGIFTEEESLDWLLGLPAWVQAMLATLFTYFMTALGASFVFFSGRFNSRILNAMQGTAAGIMIAASFFSLLLPAKERLEAANAGAMTAIVLSVGFIAGGLFIILSNAWLASKSIFSGETRGGALMFCAMTLHNIPEGFAIGVAFGSLAGGYGAIVSAFMLALGIGIQNFPEGLCVSVPLRKQGFSAEKAFFFGQFSGLVEVFAGILGALAVGVISALLPWALAFSAGAMIAVSCAELIPPSVAEGKYSAVGGVTFGFALMMLLDVIL